MTHDIGILVLRLAAGVIMIAHGLQKLLSVSIPGVQEMLAGMGVPAASAMGAILPFAEVAAGALLILGALTRVAGIVTALVAVGAIVTVHGSQGFYAADGGYEFVLLLAAAGIALALTGPGRIAVDALFARPRARRLDSAAARSEGRPAGGRAADRTTGEPGATERPAADASATAR